MTRLVPMLLVVAHRALKIECPRSPPEKMSEAQKKAVQDYKDLRKQDLTGPPWSVILRVPDLVVPSLQMRLHNLNNSALSPKLTEFAIMIAARHWTNNYEWAAHSTLAGRAGLSPAILAAVADGRRPEHMAEDEALIYDFCTELLHNQSVSDRYLCEYAGEIRRGGYRGGCESGRILHLLVDDYEYGAFTARAGCQACAHAVP